tara:strand:+ start:500 stop:853 length:354 start_codon:yes stop_codon:yes gene_type:complete
MAGEIKIEVVTPSEMLLSDTAEMVIIPGSEGIFGVLPKHAATIANLKLGKLDVYNNGVIKRRFLIDGGVADVLPERVIILAERAVDLDAVSVQNLDQKIINATDTEVAFLNAVKEAI